LSGKFDGYLIPARNRRYRHRKRMLRKFYKLDLMSEINGRTLKLILRNSSTASNSILYIEGEKCMIFPKVQFVARGRSPRATKHRGKNEHSLQKYIYYFFHGRE
jgi:hypothetical protein